MSWSRNGTELKNLALIYESSDKELLRLAFCASWFEKLASIQNGGVARSHWQLKRLRPQFLLDSWPVSCAVSASGVWEARSRQRAIIRPSQVHRVLLEPIRYLLECVQL